jgi:hypothetical protein
MKRYLVVLSIAVAALIGVGTTLSAHHSFAATYREDQTVTITGELVQFQFRNPHSFVQLKVTEKDGTERRYAAEWGGSSQLGGQGVNATTLKVGDKVVITGSPARNFPEEPRVRLITLTRTSDNYTWGKKAGETVN